jgi:hypothetical protein
MNATCDNPADVNGETRVFLMDLPAGQHWTRFDDANVIALAAHLDKSAQHLALIDAGRPDLI